MFHWYFADGTYFNEILLKNHEISFKNVVWKIQQFHDIFICFRWKMAGKLVLVAVYYTFDLDYPGVYGHNVMGIMNISSARDYLFNLQCNYVGLKIKLENIVCTKSFKITFLK